VWVTPALLFFALVFLKFVNSGYLLVVSPPFFCWLGLWASQRLKFAALAALAAVNVAVFLFAPLYCSYSSVRRFEADLDSLRRALPEIASPTDTLIVGFDSHFLGYRHAGYYLPEYLTIQFPEVRLAAGMRVFAMQHRDTRVESCLSQARYERFVLFPLPPGDREYQAFWSNLRARFPQGALRIVSGGGREFSAGSTSSLSPLFPKTLRCQP